ncbi:MAG: amidase [Burkholderiaceae bacterium]
MLPDDLLQFEITELAARIQSRQVSPVEVTRQVIDAIERSDSRYHAFVTVTHDLALAQARDAEARVMRREYLGPLHGVPIALKDLCHTAGVRTSAGMPLLADFVPAVDGTVVRKLREAGSVTVGKTQLTEGAFTEHHPEVTVPVNPWRDDLWPGASSSGSGVATALGLCFGAIGSDTGGSIRFPSAANAVTGLKPTWGRVSRHGSFALADSLDHLGPMCRSAADCGLMLAEIAGADAQDPMASLRPVPDMMAGWPGDLKGVRLGVDPVLISAGLDEPTRQALTQVVKTFEGLNATIVTVAMPDPRQMVEDWPIQCAVEAAIAHEHTYPSRRTAYGPTLAGFLDLAPTVTAGQLQRIWQRRAHFRAELERVLRSVDAMLTPVQPRAGLTNQDMATLGEDPEALNALIRYTAPIDMSGHPTMTMPIGFTVDGRPIACQLLARQWAEDRLVLLGRAYQGVTTYHRRRPPRA